jgi:hypothetical protein
VVMDAGHPHYYMDNVLGNPFPMDISPTLLWRSCMIHDWSSLLECKWSS